MINEMPMKRDQDKTVVPPDTAAQTDHYKGEALA